MSLLLAAPLAAHEAPTHEHARLVPIPEYSQPYGPASGAAALQAVEALLAAFGDDEKGGLMFDIDAEERTQWSNLPAGARGRSGVSIGEMSDEQRGLLFEFLASSLGEEGYLSVAETVAAEAFLSKDKRAGFPLLTSIWMAAQEFFGGERRSARLRWAPENYWLSIYGAPSADSPWGWQFGGHHLALNISIDGNRVTTMSPSFIGTEPAVFTLNGVDYEAVRDMHLAGYAVFAALDPEQQAAADAGKAPRDVLTGRGKDGQIPDAIGIAASEMNGEQQGLLLAAIAEWVSIQPEENAEPRMAELADGIDGLSFSWTGTDEVNTKTYMRIQGPTLIIELLSTGGNVARSAEGAGHYHTIYRNPTREYGL